MKYHILVAISLAMVFATSGCASNTSPINNVIQDEITSSESDGTDEELEQKEYDFTVDFSQIKTKDISSGVTVHDPSIIKANGEYYIFVTLTTH